MSSGSFALLQGIFTSFLVFPRARLPWAFTVSRAAGGRAMGARVSTSEAGRDASDAACLGWARGAFEIAALRGPGIGALRVASVVLLLVNAAKDAPPTAGRKGRLRPSVPAADCCLVAGGC
jgi:hypothetical protein